MHTQRRLGQHMASLALACSHTWCVSSQRTSIWAGAAHQIFAQERTRTNQNKPQKPSVSPCCSLGRRWALHSTGPRWQRRRALLLCRSPCLRRTGGSCPRRLVQEAVITKTLMLALLLKAGGERCRSGAENPWWVQSIARMALAAGVASGAVEPEAEAVLMKLAEEWVTTALAFGCGAARRRRSDRLTTADVAPYLERTWCAAQHRPCMQRLLQCWAVSFRPSRELGACCMRQAPARAWLWFRHGAPLQAASRLGAAPHASGCRAESDCRLLRSQAGDSHCSACAGSSTGACSAGLVLAGPPVTSLCSRPVCMQEGCGDVAT
jgi:hypothetical protein